MLLSGVTVIEWADGLSAPFCCRILADLGAEVIKIEQPGGGDALRRDGPFWREEEAPNDSALFNYINRGKRSITLDPTVDSGAGLVRRLASQASLVVESQAPGTLSKFGLSLDELQRENPALVMLSVTPFGQTGPLRDAAWSDLMLQHYSSFAYNQARPVEKPDEQPPIAGADQEGPLAIGVSAALAVLWGLIGAQVGGRGTAIDLAALDFYAGHVSPEPLAEWCDGEREFNRYRKEFKGTEVAGGLVWIVRCRDGWTMVSPREEHQWERWIALLDHPGWSKDKALCGNRAARKTNYVRLQELMSEWSCTKSRREVFENAQRARVACFPVNTAADVLADAQLEHRRFFNTLRSRTGSALPMGGLPFHVLTSDGDTLEPGREFPVLRLGEANEDIFRKRLNLSDSEIEMLRRERVV